MTSFSGEVHQRHCLVLKILDSGPHLTWTRRRLDRIVHFIIREHDEIAVHYHDWLQQVFGFHSKTLQEDITNLLIADAVSFRYLATPPIEVICLARGGIYHLSTSVEPVLGNGICTLLENLVPRLRNENANFRKGELIKREVFRESNPHRSIWQLRPVDVIEDSEFGTAYIVVNGEWIPIETVEIFPSGIQLKERF